MTTAQDDIDALLGDAQAAVDEISRSLPDIAAGAPSRAAPPRAAQTIGDERLERILSLSVPVIVRLARRSIPINEIMQWGRGTIVEFNKSVDSPLELLVNDCCIGEGQTVKVGEKFGLHVTGIGGAEARVRSLGGRQGRGVRSGGE